LILFILTEGLVVYSNLQFYYSLFFVLRSLLKHQFNMSRNFFCFFSVWLTVSVCPRSGCKVQLFQSRKCFESFENFRFRFSSYSPFIQRHHLLNLSKNFCSFGRDNYLFHFSQFIFTLKGYLLFASIKISKNVCCYCGCKLTLLYPNKPFF
jgi:hypothetical protein